ncbi:MAG: hypothetical protein Q9N62_01560 [Ghiorsea sp.]|nr:hypothetical protein [Ghiorsea sp.]
MKALEEVAKQVVKELVRQESAHEICVTNDDDIVRATPKQYIKPCKACAKMVTPF